MSQIRIREVQNLDYRDPRTILLKLREVECQVARSVLPADVRHLRTRRLKKWSEMRQAALFCYGMGQREGKTVHFALSESQDYDFVASWIAGDTQRFFPVQLKEVVPNTLNADASIQKVVDSLRKYVNSEDLTVAIHFNQHGRLDTQDLRIPALRIGAVWVFGGISKDQSEWSLLGDILEQPVETRFTYPT